MITVKARANGFNFNTRENKRKHGFDIAIQQYRMGVESNVEVVCPLELQCDEGKSGKIEDFYTYKGSQSGSVARIKLS